MLERAKEMMAVVAAPEGVRGPLTVTEDGWLEGPGVIRVPSVRSSALTSRTSAGEPAPLGVCWHWTGGVCRAGYAGVLAKKIRTYRHGVDRAASWHLVISKQGWVYQSVSLARGAWHSAHGQVHVDDRSHRVNRSLIGIELENAGRVKHLDGQWRCHPYWRDATAASTGDVELLRTPDPALIIPTERVTVVPHVGAFDDFPRAQIVAAGYVLAAAHDRYGLADARCGYNHGDFEPKKEDAGPVWRRHLRSVFSLAGLDPDAVPGEGTS